MSLVPDGLVIAFRRVMRAFQSTRGPIRHAQRPIPDAIVEKYHRAIWAIDTLGVPADADRWALREMWRNATFVAANASGPEGGLIADDIIKTLNELCERILREAEKDPNRPEWEKQRDFIVGSLRRVRRACMMNDVGHLHFYKKNDQMFSIETHHPVFQVGYHLWQGIVEEMKGAVTFTVFRDRPLHLRVENLLARVRGIISAVQHQDFSGFKHYDPRKSRLALSPEQEGRLLWEAVREEIASVIALSEASEAA